MQFDVYFYSFQNHFVQHHKNNLLLLNNPLNNLLPLLHYIQHILLLDVYYIDEFFLLEVTGTLVCKASVVKIALKTFTF